MPDTRGSERYKERAKEWRDRAASLPEGRYESQPALAKTRRRGRRPRRVGHNLLLRLSTRRLDVLRFLTDPSVPFTNLAERDGRMMKLRRKISGGFRSECSAKDFAVIRAVLSTARKQGGICCKP